MALSQAFAMIAAKWSPPRDTQPSFAGRNVIVTGSNVGIGFEAAVKFVQLGADRVILAVRSLSKGEAARNDIEKRTGRQGCVDVWPLDMMDYDSLKSFAARASKELDHLDIAVLNAGVHAAAYHTSQYGWENTLQVNTLSTTLLALLLLPKLRASRTDKWTPVLEFVGSSNHYLVTEVAPETRKSERPLERFNSSKGYFAIMQYSLSKLFLMYAQSGIVDYLRSSSPTGQRDVHVVVVCPGATQSDLARDYSQWYMAIVKQLFKWIMMKTTEEGARTYISGATLGEKGDGRFWTDDKIKASAPMLVGVENQQFQEKVWKDIVQTLSKEVPEVRGMLDV